MTNKRPDSCPRCGESCTSHTGNYCHKCGEVLVVPSSNNRLEPYCVSIHETPGDTFTLFFDCQAEDADHAAEQAEDAYPGCEVVNVTID